MTKRPRGLVPPGAQHVNAALVAEHATVQPGGQTRIGVYFTMDRGWHIYAQDPGDAGLPTNVSWSVPDGVAVGPLRWPKPKKFRDPGKIRTFGYANAVLLASTLNPAPESAGAAIPIRARVKWLACKRICVPGSADVSLSLPVSLDAPTLSPNAKLFEHS